MGFVTIADFNIRPYKLPNLDNEPLTTEFNTFVDEWEEEWLPKIFGQSFYNVFAAGVAALPDEWIGGVTAYVIGDEVVRGKNIYTAVADNNNVNPATDDGTTWELTEENNRWLLIIKGGDYTPKAQMPQKWIGLMAAEKFAIFSSWVKASINSVSGVAGNVAATVENSDITSSAGDIASSWNKFSRLIGGRTYCDTFNTLFGFILSFNNTDTFDDTFDETFHSSLAAYVKSQFGWPGRLNAFNI